MVYASPSLALASVEMYVHIDPSLLPDDLVYTVATLPDSAGVEHIRSQDLPANWRAMDHPELKLKGAEWIASRRSLALQVPSAAVEGEWNVLLNPRHREFDTIEMSGPTPWRFDERLLRRL